VAVERERAAERGQGRAVPPAAIHALQIAVGLAASALPLLFAALLPPDLPWRGAFDVVHSALQMFLVGIGGTTFAVQWYAAARGLDEARGRFLGAAFLCVAILEALHLLATPGMAGILGPASADRGVAYWHLARVTTALALLGAAWVPAISLHPLLRRGPLLVLSLALAAVLAAAELRFVGQGTPPGTAGRLPDLRLGLGLGTMALAAAGMALHVLRFRRSGDRLFLRVAMALGLLALGQAADALSAAPGDPLEICSHLYAAVAGWLVYDALFAAAVLDPYARLEAASRELRATNAHLEQLRGRVEGELAETIGRLAETTDREAEARAELEAAIAAVPEAIAVYSPGGSVVRQNEVARQLFAAARDLREDSAMSRWKALQPRTTDGRPFALEEHPLARALRGETVRGCVMAIRPPGRKPTWVSVSAAPIRAGDELVGAVAAVADVSALQDLQAQLEDLLRAVSHDLRNPLQIVLLQGERLLRVANAEGHEKVRHSATAVIAAGRQMGSLIRDLVDAARMESGRQRLACQPLDLRAWLPGLISLSAGAIDPARVRLDLPPDLPLAWADPARLDRVFLNLLGNALRHSPPGAEVRIRAEARGDEVAVAVEDSGQGVAPEDLPHLFERFYRGKASAGDGLGLGLYIVRLLVEAHGGRIRAESTPGRGSAFTFTLPLALPPSGAPPAGG